jgi:hypothetical protein
MLVAGASLGWASTGPAFAATPLTDSADVVFAEGGDDIALELVDYNTKLQRQQERDCKKAARDQEKACRDQERMAKKTAKGNKPCRDRGCRDGADWGGIWDKGCGLFDDGCDMFTGDLGDPWTVNSLLFDECEEPCYTLGGWVSAGYTNKSDGVFNTRPGALNLHQAWLYLEKIADGSNGVGFGGRIDALYGMDSNNTNSYGNNPGRYDFSGRFQDSNGFGIAIPQAYAQVAYENLSVKIGHFYTIQGYEVVGATGNFFYSHALTFNFMEPFTHTGALATYKVDDKTELYGGYVFGWDSGFDQFHGGSSWIGGFKVSPMDNMSFVYTSCAGNLGWIGDGYSQSIVVTTNLTDKLTSVVGGDVVHGNGNGVFAGVPTATSFDGLSVYNYLLYQINARNGVGMRNEWAKFGGVSYNEITVGWNYKPLANLTVRPEYRYQYSPAANNGGKNPIGIPVNQGIFGVDAVLTF